MGTVTDIRIAKRTGFCYGVREAIDKAKEASAAGKSTHTLGQVVHNEGVVRDLQSLGIRSFSPQVTACPGCGRTTSTFFQEMAEQIHEYLRERRAEWQRRYRLASVG